MAKKNGLSFYRRRKKVSSAMLREIFSWIFGIVVAIFIATVLNMFFGMTSNVVGTTMEPNLYSGEKIYIDKFLYLISSPKEGDVILFLPNGNANAHYYVKRVIACPGDKIYISNGNVYVNDEKSEWVSRYVADPGIAAHEFVLGSSEYFCIGDNPANSEDSRSANIGPIKEKDIIGKVWFHAGTAESGMGFVK